MKTDLMSEKSFSFMGRHKKNGVLMSNKKLSITNRTTTVQ